MVKTSFLVLVLCTLFANCASVNGSKSEQSALNNELNKNSLIKNVLDSFDKYESQIIYTQIDRDKNNKPSFKSFDWNSKPNHYFYPASMVKMPVALLAAEKINELRNQKTPVHLFSPMKIRSGHTPQSSVEHDTTSITKLPSVGHYIKKIFVVSDNDAYNRLYEFVGQLNINQRLKELGYKNSHIIHRLDAPEFDLETNKYTNPVEIYEEDLKLYNSDEKYNSIDVRVKNLTNLKKGIGYVSGDSIIHSPFDFSTKNFFSLIDMHTMIKAIMFPESVPTEKRFDIADHDMEYIRTQMSKLPKESKYPKYDSTHLDGYCKFFMFGDTKEKMPDHIRIFNKVGWAYGYLIDAAYIVDFKNGVEFILSALIHVNADGIYNDGLYEYESKGLPYLSQLGSVFYNYELKRIKKNKPVLTEFKMNYKE